MNTDKKALSGIEQRMDAIICLLAAPIVNGKTLAETVPVLSRLGLDRNQIAAVCNTTPETVSVRLAEAKRRRQSPRRRPPSAASKQSSQETTS